MTEDNLAAVQLNGHTAARYCRGRDIIGRHLAAVQYANHTTVR